MVECFMGTLRKFIRALSENKDWRSEPEPIPVSTRMSYNDAISKHKMNVYSDTKRHTSDSFFDCGSHVFAKQQKRNKLTPPYDPDPYTVVQNVVTW